MGEVSRSTIVGQLYAHHLVNSRSKPSDPSYRTVKWNGIQHALEEAESDVLLLLDCCSSGTANTDVGHGVTELIAAAGFNGTANPVGANSFTEALITELTLMRNLPAFTVGALYSKILCRLQSRLPSPGEPPQRPPLHVVLTQNHQLPRSIRLSPQRARSQNMSHISLAQDTIQGPPSPNIVNMSSSNSSLSTKDSPRQYPSTPPESSASPDLESCAKIIISIKLKETFTPLDFPVDLFGDWLQMMPVLAEQVRIEAGFTSFSTVVIMSMPICVWCYLQDDPAISVVGLTRSSNFLHAHLAQQPFTATEYGSKTQKSGNIEDLINQKGLKVDQEAPTIPKQVTHLVLEGVPGPYSPRDYFTCEPSTRISSRDGSGKSSSSTDSTRRSENSLGSKVSVWSDATIYTDASQYELQKIKPTPRTLEWVSDKQLWKRYNTVVVNDKVSHLELLPGFSPSDLTPSIVYIDQPE